MSVAVVQVAKPKSPEPEATLTFPFLDKMPETNQLHLPNPSSQGKGRWDLLALHSLLGPPVLNTHHVKNWLHPACDVYQSLSLAVLFTRVCELRISDWKAEMHFLIDIGNPSHCVYPVARHCG
jgi:hypothetical protein